MQTPEKLHFPHGFGCHCCWQLVAQPAFGLQPVLSECTHWLYTFS